MKRIFTILAFMPLATTVFGQAITINSTDVPVPTGSYNMVNFTATSAAAPTIGSSGTWDYSAYTGSAFTSFFATETDTFFTNRGIDVYTPGFKSLVPSFGYDTYWELDFNTANVKETGVEIEAQAYDLSSFGGASTDSIIFPAQKAIVPNPKVSLKFPFTANSAWSNITRKVTDFKLTVGAFSLSNTPGQHVYYTHRKDTIIGWGKVRVYTATGRSIPYDVLVDRVSQYNVDSFYLNGSPAPAALLSAFTMTQDQKTDSAYSYLFLRKSSFMYLLAFSYGSDATFTTPRGKFFNTDNITPASVGVDEAAKASFSTVVFPNPATGSEVNMLIIGNDIPVEGYSITDLMGRVVLSGKATNQQTLHIPLNGGLANGRYVITVMGNNQHILATEQFEIAK